VFEARYAGVDLRERPDQRLLPSCPSPWSTQYGRSLRGSGCAQT